ncbi:MAG TPA: alpha/beta hydrolase [Geminicoccaceae bacterium]|nr:alpha/beta hydrolase [Geminicoccus sp.]HMU50847.1 alpha/beta hydrolase [Geminicoccaceae bacterium]
MLEGFETRSVETSGTRIFLRRAGDGPPLLLLHGYPQTHVMWHRVAPSLAARFTVVCPDLRGYGDSGKPPGGTDHAGYSKRAMARDMVEVMAALGFERFAVAGHDRGGRVTHRMCLDHPRRIERAAVLDIVPTRTIFDATDKAIAGGYYHWFFLSQPAPLPERLIGGDPLFYLHRKLGAWGAAGLSSYAPGALAEYERCFGDPATIHATCEDYRAAATIDLEHDTADQDARIACPLLVLWGEKGLMQRNFDVLATWREKAGASVEGRALPCGHFLPEEQPEATTAELARFFAEGRAA